MRSTCFLLLFCLTLAHLPAQADSLRGRAEAIVAGIEEAGFADRSVSILDFGARADTNYDSRPAILQALRGGGRVVVPRGHFRSNGPIHLPDSTQLYLSEGAVLSFSDEPADYLPVVTVRWEGTVAMNYSPLIYAQGKSDIGIGGPGTIDGNGRRWSTMWRKRQKADKTRLRQLGNDLVPLEERRFGPGHYLRPGLVQFYDCERVSLTDFTIRDAPFWTIHLPFTDHVVARGLRIFGTTLNDDGLDPDSSQDVLIEDCYFETHDDAISIKAGRDQDAWKRGASRRIVVRDCVLNSGVNSLAIGSELSGGVAEVYVYDCTITRGRYGINVKTNDDRGGFVRNVHLWNVRADSLERALIRVTTEYKGYRGNDYPTDLGDVSLTDVWATSVGQNVLQFVGLSDQQRAGIRLNYVGLKPKDRDDD